MSNEIVPIAALERMAQAVAASKLFGITNADQALALMLVAQAEGLHPATAARDYHIIQGRPSLKADAMLARYLASGGKVEWHDHTDAKVAATFIHPAGGSLRIDWDMERAKKAGLGGKDMWTKYPRQMLRARVISEGIRATNPAIATGIYTPEEVMDMEPAPKPRKEKEINPLPAGGGDEKATGGIPPSRSVPPSSDAAPGEPSETRTQTLIRLCEEAQMRVIDILNKGGVKSAEELTTDDWNSAVRLLKRKASSLKAPA